MLGVFFIVLIVVVTLIESLLDPSAFLTEELRAARPLRRVLCLFPPSCSVRRQPRKSPRSVLHLGRRRFATAPENEKGRPSFANEERNALLALYGLI